MCAYLAIARQVIFALIAVPQTPPFPQRSELLSDWHVLRNLIRFVSAEASAGRFLFASVCQVILALPENAEITLLSKVWAYQQMLIFSREQSLALEM